MSSAAAEPGGGVLFPRFATAVLLVLALVLRLEAEREGAGTLGFRAHQTAFFTLSAIAYERQGLARTLGYPSPTIDGVGWSDDDVAPLAGEPPTVVYVNHPPTVPLLAWSWLKLRGEEGWNTLWRAGRPPGWRTDAICEPFLVLHLLGLWAFAWCVRQALGTLAGLFALALLAVMPVAIHWGFGVGYENPSLPAVFLALGFWVRHAQSGARRELVACAVCLALGTCVTWGPLFLVPAIAVECAVRRWFELARRALVVLGGAALVPLLAHALLAHATGAEHAGFVRHAGEIAAPLVDAPVDWLYGQAGHALTWIGLPLLALCALGLAVLLLRSWRTKPAGTDGSGGSVSVSLVLLGAGILQIAAFARHAALDQPNFQLVLAPGIAATGAVFLVAVAGRAGYQRLIAALALLSAVAVPSMQRARDEFSTWPLDPDRALHHHLLRAGDVILDNVPPEAVVLVPDWYTDPLAVSLAAWRTVQAVGDPGELPALRARHPAAGGRPAYACVPLVKGENAKRAASFARFRHGIPAAAQAVPGSFKSVWLLP